jgi:phosphatidylethanolamine/phosphatidyl-N-methylethanolamine N-methyltransferase
MGDAIARKTLATILRDEFLFLRSLIGDPARTGAVSPSGRALATLMASHVDPTDPLPVLELGPGTGVVTKALIERGVRPEKIIAVEYNPQFCRLIADRLPGVRVVQGDAYDLSSGALPLLAGPFSAIVSSLPLITRPEPVRLALIDSALDRVDRGRPFIQFSYSWRGPAPAVPGRFTVERSRWIVMNMPPARVWTYRRPAA